VPGCVDRIPGAPSAQQRAVSNEINRRCAPRSPVSRVSTLVDVFAAGCHAMARNQPLPPPPPTPSQPLTQLDGPVRRSRIIHTACAAVRSLRMRAPASSPPRLKVVQLVDDNAQGVHGHHCRAATATAPSGRRCPACGSPAPPSRCSAAGGAAASSAGRGGGAPQRCCLQRGHAPGGCQGASACRGGVPLRVHPQGAGCPRASASPTVQVVPGGAAARRHGGGCQGRGAAPAAAGADWHDPAAGPRANANAGGGGGAGNGNVAATHRRCRMGGRGGREGRGGGGMVCMCAHTLWGAAWRRADTEEGGGRRSDGRVPWQA
jgi:hypothetical protein